MYTICITLLFFKLKLYASNLAQLHATDNKMLTASKKSEKPYLSGNIHKNSMKTNLCQDLTYIKFHRTLCISSWVTMSTKVFLI